MATPKKTTKPAPKKVPATHKSDENPAMNETPRPQHAKAPNTPPPAVGTVIAQLEELKGEFGTAAAALSTDLLGEVARLQDLHAEGDQIADRLLTLHGIDPQITVGDVIRAYEASDLAFQKDFQARKNALATVQTARQMAWRTEIEDRTRAAKERAEEDRKAVLREAEQYTYDLNQQRLADADAWTQAHDVRRKVLRDTIAATEKAWEERERDLADRETAFGDLKTRFEELPQRLADAIKRARGEGIGIATAQAKTKADMVAKEVEGEKRLQDVQISQLQIAVSNRIAQIAAMKDELAQVQRQGQDLAMKSIESASSAQSFGAVQAIALKQAENNSTKTK